MADGYSVWVMVGFILAACVNLFGILGTSRCFTNRSMAAAWPSLWENEGVAIVCLWGLAYLSVCTTYRHVPYLCLLFCAEKVYYTIAWWYLRYLRNAETRGETDAREKSCLSRFFTIARPREVVPADFGYFDGVFAIFFGYVAIAIWAGVEAPGV